MCQNRVVTRRRVLLGFGSTRIRRRYMDHDRLFKELLTTFFVDFLEVFCPELRKNNNSGQI